MVRRTAGPGLGRRAFAASRRRCGGWMGTLLLPGVFLLAWALPLFSQSPGGGAPAGADLVGAIRRGDLQAVQALCKVEGAVRARDKAGMTPLHYAAFQGRTEAARVLLKSGAPVDAPDAIGMTPLHAAAYGGHEETLRVLLDAQAPVDAQDSFGMTPLHYAALNGHAATLRILLERGARRDLRDAQGRTAEDLAQAAGKPEPMAAFRTPPRDPPRPPLVVTDDSLRLPPTTGYVAPPPPDPCCSKPGAPLPNSGELASLEEQLRQLQVNQSDLQSRLPELKRRCEEAAYALQEGSGFTANGSYSREEEFRTQKLLEENCRSYKQAVYQLEYYRDAIESVKRSLERLRLNRTLR